MTLGRFSMEVIYRRNIATYLFQKGVPEDKIMSMHGTMEVACNQILYSPITHIVVTSPKGILITVSNSFLSFQVLTSLYGWSAFQSSIRHIQDLYMYLQLARTSA